MEPIDYFKYKALLAELESNKDSKGGMTRFINKVYALSQQLIFTDKFKESTRYAFILITKAAYHNKSIRTCPRAISQHLDTVSNTILNSTIVTADNVLETFEFWNTSIRFVPSNLTDLHRIEAILQVLTPRHSSVTLHTYHIQELMAVYGKRDLLTKLYVLSTIGKESLILKYLSSCRFDAEPVISDLESIITNLQLILKEAHEHHSCGSTTI